MEHSLTEDFEYWCILQPRGNCLIIGLIVLVFSKCELWALVKFSYAIMRQTEPEMMEAIVSDFSDNQDESFMVWNCNERWLLSIPNLNEEKSLKESV